jgi:hypothetical protein
VRNRWERSHLNQEELAVRSFRILLIGAVALTVTAACGARPPATAAPLSAEQLATKSSCEALNQAYNNSMAPFAEALTGMLDDRTKGQAAQKALRDLATAVRTATDASGDTALRTDGKRTADSLTAKAADKTFFAGIKTRTDVDNVLGPDLKSWLSPVTRHCS